MRAIRSILLPIATLFAVLVIAAACETAPPVQEMSDARQAIAVAREAGAETHATEELLQAERFLDSAEQNLSDQHYAEARRDALEAKSRAVAARRKTEASQQNEQ